ncbi:DedA family protein [Antricoccus suffuscus]|nr:DedA family protein [Antricoccus suffuscus]
MNIDAILTSIPVALVYVLVALFVGVESLGIPLPGEIVLVAAALLSSHPGLGVSPIWVAVAGILGAAVGDSIGYGIGHRYGRRLFAVMGRRFPKHVNDDTVAYAEHIFRRFGVLAVFFGRFIALLRIFAGPLAGMLRMHYRRFLAANIAGAVCWAGGTTLLIYLLGTVADRWLKDFSWVALLIAVVVGIAAAVLLRHRVERNMHAFIESRRTGSVDQAE